MATIALDPVAPTGSRRLLGLAAPVLILALLAAGLVYGVSRLASMLTEPIDAEPTRAAQAVIEPGNGPAVAATARARIISLDCTLAGPVEVAGDGTGAFIVTAGAGQVRCPQGDFRNGFTLRWPSARPPQTRPAG